MRSGSPFLLVVHAADGPRTGEAAVILRGVDGKEIRLTRDDLQKLPRTELEVADHRGKKGRYSGVALRVFLDKLKVPKGEAFRGEWMRAFVVVEAADDYRAIFALPSWIPASPTAW